MRQLPEKKANLIERLQSNDRNKNFGVDCEIQEEIAYLSPATDTFRDIIADTSLPMITRQAIQEYFESYVPICNDYNLRQLFTKMTV
ncbi:hypothetical protein O3G_MSEX000408 [Manduca sexta]|nr:hypothetical protein O3G_MSEX000408 [Manduca sexta]